MTARLATILFVFLVLVGCATIDGVYAPSCPSFAGSEITLADSSFVWRKFTDVVKIDKSGNKVDPYPGFPREGGYKASGNKLTLTATDGTTAAFSIAKAGNSIYLLTASENTAYESSGEIPRCALQRQPAGT